MSAENQRTALAVIGALPSHYLPMYVTVDEAVTIGKHLFPEWICLQVRNPEQKSQLNCLLEMLGRGFLFSSIRSVPEWLRMCWAYKIQLDDDSSFEEICTLVYDQDDAEKLAKHWVKLACGWSQDEVIEEYLCDPVEPDPDLLPAWLEDRFKSMEDA